MQLHGLPRDPGMLFGMPPAYASTIRLQSLTRHPAVLVSDALFAVLQVYLASSAPPVRFPNVYGVDMPNRKEFVAHGLTEEQVGGWYNNCY
jgi:hypothetical protein